MLLALFGWVLGKACGSVSCELAFADDLMNFGVEFLTITVECQYVLVVSLCRPCRPVLSKRSLSELS